ncbi:SDR family oxidoreductase [Novosphingobium profundi]|uniref:SDR family NAD(P)-dependent oxidoreductase n=1 Tax=Novosphingobium profundi TaxID=1774954 RepID=UPI001BDA0581|nr:SDR family oxidoreductase [Novosphingobium profundi]MBT0667107.1 SDR family oxidoreductase [Novosphingobium profundi]
MSLPTLEGRCVVVTGGAGGIGRAIVAAFLARGARVVCADLSVADEEPGATGRAVNRRLDVTDEASWIALMDFVVARFGRLDVLVNNAGLYRPNIVFEDMELATWRQHMAVNADGTFLGCKHAIRRMKPHGEGAIVNMASGMAITANPTGAAYCAAKAAVLMTTRTAARAAGPYGVRVNVVLPGAVPTEMLMGNLTGNESEGDFLARMAGYSALGRLAQPEDIARAVVFLADPANGAISGVHLPVDGGALPGA